MVEVESTNQLNELISLKEQGLCLLYTYFLSQQREVSIVFASYLFASDDALIGNGQTYSNF